MRLNMNLQREFENLLKEYGHDVLVIRQDRKLHCSCINDVTKEATRECPLCFGLGYAYTAERHTTRADIASSPLSLPRQLVGSSVGDVIAGDKMYFFKPNVMIQEKDLVVEVDWSENGKATYHNKGIWEITKVDDTKKFKQGQDVYKIGYSSITPVRNNIRGIRITEVNGIRKYSVLLEE